MSSFTPPPITTPGPYDFHAAGHVTFNSGGSNGSEGAPFFNSDGSNGSDAPPLFDSNSSVDAADSFFL